MDISSKKFKKVMCFDVDMTFIDGNTWENYADKIGLDYDFSYSAYKDFYSEITNYKEYLTILNVETRRLKKSKNDFLKATSGIPLSKNRLDIVKKLKDLGYKIYLVSGGINLSIIDIAQRIDADGYYEINKIVFDDNGEFSHYELGKDPSGRYEKIDALNYISKKENVEIKDILFIGDGYSDLEAFKETGNGVAYRTRNENLKDLTWLQIQNFEEIHKIIKEDFPLKLFKNYFDRMVSAHTGDILINTHLIPDGDAVASILSTYYYIKNNLEIDSKNINMVIEGDYVDDYEYFKNYKDIKFVKDLPDTISKLDNPLCIFLDAKYYDRFTNSEKLDLLSTDIKFSSICIDHHGYENRQKFDLYFTPEENLYSSCAEMLYLSLFRNNLSNLKQDICEILLLGMVTDTERLATLKNDNLEVYDYTKELVKQGDINMQKLINTYSQNSVKALQIVGCFLKNLKHKKVNNWPDFTYTFISKEDALSFTQAEINEAKSLINGRKGGFPTIQSNIKEANWGFIAIPTSKGYSVSFRSLTGLLDSIDVQHLTTQFENGGGHKHKAGIKFKETDVNKIIAQILDYIQNNKPIFQ